MTSSIVFSLPRWFKPRANLRKKLEPLAEFLDLRADEKRWLIRKSEDARCWPAPQGFGDETLEGWLRTLKPYYDQRKNWDLFFSRLRDWVNGQDGSVPLARLFSVAVNALDCHDPAREECICLVCIDALDRAAQSFKFPGEPGSDETRSDESPEIDTREFALDPLTARRIAKILRDEGHKGATDNAVAIALGRMREENPDCCEPVENRVCRGPLYLYWPHQVLPELQKRFRIES
jgi:hypothetical protein